MFILISQLQVVRDNVTEVSRNFLVLPFRVINGTNYQKGFTNIHKAVTIIYINLLLLLS